MKNKICLLVYFLFILEAVRAIRYKVIDNSHLVIWITTTVESS